MADNQNAAQAARRRKRRKATQGSLSWKTLLASAARVPLRAGRRAGSFALRHKGATGIALLALLGAWGTGSGLHALHAWADATLPSTIVVDAPTRALKENVTRIAGTELARARKTKETRAALLRRISSELDALDPIDSYEVRAGLDAKLQIRVTSQVPLFVLEGQGKERVLIGHRMKVLQRKVGQAEYPHLLRISTPDFRVAQAFTQAPATAGATVRPNARMRTLAPMNFAWLAGQGSRIRETLRKQKTTYLIEEISWRQTTGFTLRMRDAEGHERGLAGATGSGNTGTGTMGDAVVATAGNVPQGAGAGSQPLAANARASAGGGPSAPHAPAFVEITLGESDLDRKIARIPEIFADLAAKGLGTPATIDLNYGDKALIRLSESGAPTPL